MCHVLIIEDEALVAMDLQNVLSEAGRLRSHSPPAKPEQWNRRAPVFRM